MGFLMGWGWDWGLPSGVEAEGDLIAVHHDVGDVAVAAGGVLDLSAEEDTSVGVHGGLVGRNGLVQFPEDDALRVIEQVLANTRDILDKWDAEFRQLGLGAQTRKQQKSRGVDCACADDGLALGAEGTLLAVLECDIDTCDLVALDIDLADPRIGEHSQVLTLLLLAKDGVDVSDTSAAPSAIVRVV